MQILLEVTLQSETVMKGGVAALAIALIAIIVVRQMSGDEAAVVVASSAETSAVEDQAEFVEEDPHCMAAQDRYDNVMNMYTDRGSSEIMEQALLEAEENLDANCDS